MLERDLFIAGGLLLLRFQALCSLRSLIYVRISSFNFKRLLCEAIYETFVYAKILWGLDNLVIYKLALSYFFFFLDKFVLKTWISRRVFYFVGIRGVGDIFLPICPQVLFL